MSLQTNYNERSWAIDLISEINIWLENRDIRIKRAGGENTLKTSSGSKFPDVLIYGDKADGLILQGWELKMPDTPINDDDLLDNAAAKAVALGLNSFLVWNVTTAALYILEGASYRQIKTWENPANITSRSQVHSNKKATSEMLESILNDLNQYFNDGVIKSARYIDAITGDGIADMLVSNLEVYSEELKTFGIKDYRFEDEVNLWWLSSKLEYPDENDKWRVLARNNLVTLFNKFIFAHALKHYNSNANIVDTLDENTSVINGIEVFENISSKADFWNVFSKNLGEELMPLPAWSNFISLNSLLSDLSIESIDTKLIHELIDTLVQRSKRKTAGQFATPKPLANLFAKLVVHDPRKHAYDPCCGTGTIAKAIYDLKLDKGIQKPLETVWASDKFSLPLRIATLNLTQTDNIGEILRIFKEDALELRSGKNIMLHDPFDGSAINEQLPAFSYIASNLPFVQQEDVSKLNKNIDSINERITTLTKEPTLKLDSRSDLYAYIPFSLWNVLEENGRLGLIISNSWLGTEMGEKFFNALSRFYTIEAIITSGKGRWFKNAKVVTNMLLMTKKSDPSQKISSSIKFVTLKHDIDDIEQNNMSEDIRSLINISGHEENDLIEVQDYSTVELNYLKSLSLPRSSYFADLSWIRQIEKMSVNISELYEVNRGERRGWDDLFFPIQSNTIEPQYLKPVLKTPRTISKLDVQPDGLAFCCSLSKDELKEKGHSGALKWIESFESLSNTIGKPLPAVLQRPGTNWYTMKPDTMADLVTSMNAGDRLFFGKLPEPTFVNQRLIRLSRKDLSVNNELVHALLNSLLGIFYLEALGFGRGEGALDLNSTKLKQSLRILNPNLVSKEAETDIIARFELLKKRDILPIQKELESDDRKHFDLAVLKAFGIESIYDNVKGALLALNTIRNATGTK